MTLTNVRNFIFAVGIVVLLIAISNIASTSRLDDAVKIVIEMPGAVG